MIVVGDLHGKIEIATKVLSVFSGEKIVFVGDYLDSFDRTDTEHIDLLNLLLDRCDGDNVQCLMGNHELSYLMPDTMICTGYRPGIQKYIDSDPVLFREIVNKFKTYTYEHGWLITHAGVSADWLPVSPELLPKCLDTLPCTEHLYEIGMARNGTAKVGGPFWCDYYKEFKPIKGIKQIFGHTATAPHIKVKGIVKTGDNYNIDCLDFYPHVLRVTDNEVETIML